MESDHAVLFWAGPRLCAVIDNNGRPLGLSYVGNVPELKVSLSVETLEHQESSSGQRLTDLQLIKTKKANSPARWKS